MSAAPQPRVLLVCEWFVKYTAGLARGLADAGCEVTLLSRDHDIEFGDEPGAMRAFVAETLEGKARHLELGGRVRELSRLPDVARLRRAIGGWGPEVVHVQDSLTHDLRLALAAGFPRSPYALTVHDPAPHPGDPQPSARIRLVRRALRRHAGLLFAHSEAMATELRQLGDARSPVEIVPHGFGEVTPSPLPERPNLLFFGRISHYKGLDTLFEAMPIVWERLPEVTLTVAGAGDLPVSEVLEDPRLNLLHEHVPEERIGELFTAATCLVLPYRQASQSGVGSEAKRYCRATIATAVGGLPELVGPDSARLVPPEDPTALAAAIAEVAGTPGLAERLGRAAGQDAAAAGWGTVGRQTLDAYRRYLV